MQLPPIVLIIIALGTMFFGYFFGLVEGRGQGYQKRKAEQEKDVLDKGGVPPEPAPALPIIQDDPGLLRLKEESGRLRVDLDGTRVTLETLMPEQRKRLIELVTRLRPWVEGRGAATEAPAAISQPVSVPRTPAKTAPLRPEDVPAATPTATTPKKEAPAAPQTMVTQIDAILQQKLENSPLAGRGIKLEEAAGGGVNVVVGIQRYDGIADVPDLDVQAAIRAAIAEWERKFTPGMQ
jgi:hypothetical protein